MKLPLSSYYFSGNLRIIRKDGSVLSDIYTGTLDNLQLYLNVNHPEWSSCQIEMEALIIKDTEPIFELSIDLVKIIVVED